MKRAISLMLGLILMLGAVGASASNDERVHFTASGVAELTDGEDYASDAVYQTLNGMFNFDYELYALTWGNWVEKNRLWISTGDMPTFTFWDFNYTEYLDYINQGLIRALPDGWEQKYPNLKAAIDSTGIADKLLVDGKSYAIPKPIFFAFVDFDAAVDTQGLFYRKDWLEKLGMEPWGDSVTIDQVIEFAKAAKEADLAGNGATVGLTTDFTKLTSAVMDFYNPAWRTFSRVDGKYAWGPTQAGVVEGIEYYRSLYDTGIIDPDFYLYTSKEHRNVFCSGTAAMMLCEASVDNVISRINEFGAVNEGDAYDKVGLTTLVANDGKWRGTASANYWAASIFNPDTDDQTMDRVLAIFDYLCTKEGQELVSLGIKGVDWTTDEAGNYTLLRQPDADGNYPHIKNIYKSIRFWFTMAVLPDAFSFNNPANNAAVRQEVLNMYGVKLAGDYLPFDADYNFFTSEAKSNYSVDITGEIVRLVLDGNADIPTEWAKFIEANRGMWEPLQDGLNEAFAG